MSPPDPIDRSRASPNFGERAQRFSRPDSVVLHYTGMRSGPAAIDWLCNPASQVSCHYVVTEEGRVLQLVDDDRRAWHAGRSFWQGETDMNSASIGIEIINGGHDFGLPPFPAPQITAVIALCALLMRRHAVPPERILAHSDIAPGRKRDPGERFPWLQLAEHGIGLWPDPNAVPVSEIDLSPSVIQANLARWGYNVPDVIRPMAETAAVIEAFQRRYRADSIDGIADADTVRRLSALIARVTRSAV